MLTRYSSFLAAPAESNTVAVEILTACQAHIEALHRLRPRPPDPESEAQRLATEVAEQVALDIHGLQDDQVTQLAASFGVGGAVAIITGAAMHDATCRVQTALNATEAMS